MQLPFQIQRHSGNAGYLSDATQANIKIGHPLYTHAPVGTKRRGKKSFPFDHLPISGGKRPRIWGDSHRRSQNSFYSEQMRPCIFKKSSPDCGSRFLSIATFRHTIINFTEIFLLIEGPTGSQINLSLL